MSNNVPLRRSRRGQKQEYGPGDKVEVVRDEGVAIGRLVRKVEQDSDSEGNVVRWIVSFVGDTEEHEVTEKYIGRLVESSETESVKSTQSSPHSPPVMCIKPTASPVMTTASKSKANASISTMTSSRSRRDKSPPWKGKSQTVGNAPSAVSSAAKTEIRPSTRSTIRQPTTATATTISKPPSVKQAINNAMKKVTVVKGIKTVKKTPQSKLGGTKSSMNETVVKVKMLTGTLYLYRGDRPRAEFIRSV